MKMEINEDFVPATKECIELEELDDGCHIARPRGDACAIIRSMKVKGEK